MSSLRKAGSHMQWHCKKEGWIPALAGITSKKLHLRLRLALIARLTSGAFNLIKIGNSFEFRLNQIDLNTKKNSSKHLMPLDLEKVAVNKLD